MRRSGRGLLCWRGTSSRRCEYVRDGSGTATGRRDRRVPDSARLLLILEPHIPRLSGWSRNVQDANIDKWRKLARLRPTPLVSEDLLSYTDFVVLCFLLFMCLGAGYNVAILSPECSLNFRFPCDS